jgi:putative aminopeptidase FrvX
MNPLPPIDQQYMRDLLIELLTTPSPTGFTEDVIQIIETAFTDLGLPPKRTLKGGVIVEWPGASDTMPRGLTAHVDTLGAMVKEIKANGRLTLTQIGSFAWNSVEGEGCTLFTSSGTLRGSFLPVKASTHVHASQVKELERSPENMEVRLDERSSSAEETRGLGIDVGDFVAFDPRVEVSDSGFIRSRHLDDKSGVACILTALKTMQDAGLEPAQRTIVLISNYEEVGHGAAAGFPPEMVELVAVDMAAVGSGQASDEFHTTICAKDSGGPYHIDLTRQLQKLAREAEIPFKTDIYPYYGSDGTAYWRAGGDVRVALIGPGVDASHNYERTHVDALVATVQLITTYLQS